MKNFLNEKLSTRAKNTVLAAQKLARSQNSQETRSTHLLCALAGDEGSFASEVLKKFNLHPHDLTTHLKKKLAAGPSKRTELKQILETAAICASQYKYKFVGTEHLLYGILSQKNDARKLLETAGSNPDEIQNYLTTLFQNTARVQENSTTDNFLQETEEETQLPTVKAFEYFTLNLTEQAESGRLTPLVGRKRELTRVISILGRKTKNNPVLIGDPGVGKTAIVEGLALAISQKQVPESLADKKILVLDLALMVAGSIYRGEFENRLKQVVEELKKDENAILFIDELHTVVGAGSATGSLDAANILKPVLGRGQLKTIGATTLTEYKKHIESDAALERRFQPVLINEPTLEETEKILQGLTPYFEKHHKVKITPAAIKEAVRLSQHHTSDRFQPDKAIDLLDETASFIKIGRQGLTKKSARHKLDNRLEKTEAEKEQAVFNQNFQKALRLQNRAAKLLKKRQSTAQPNKSRAKTLEIRPEHVATTISHITGVPQQRLNAKNQARLKGLETTLRNSIIGQDQALKQIISALKRSITGVKDKNRPLGSFMFLGPSGVGKTLTAKVLAENLGLSDQTLVRLDMSEFMERHNVARLIGAPPGYVDSDEGGRLTEAVRRNPHSVILFDEVEKAHPEVINILLQILEEGELTDAQGLTVSFKNTVVILTSNIGSAKLANWADNFGFTEQKKPESDGQKIKTGLLKEVNKRFRAELTNRLDQIIVFNPLSGKDVRKITSLELNKLKARLKEQGITLKNRGNLTIHLSKISFDPKQGARLVKKNIQNMVEDKVAEALLSKPKQKTLNLSLDKEKNILVK